MFQNSLVRAVCVAVVAALGGAGLAAATDALGFVGGDGTIQGCAKTRSGDLRLIEPGRSCGANETAVGWNQQGPAGEPGAPGTARAYAEITPEGVAYARRSHNITHVEHLEVGVYCIHVEPTIDMEEFVALVSARGGTANRFYATTFVGCGLPNHDGIQVNTFDARTDEPADVGVYMAVP